MSSFWRPEVGDTLTISGQTYVFDNLDNSPHMVFVAIGGRGRVYRLTQNGERYALKVFNAKFRSPTTGPAIIRAKEAVFPFRTLPGMEVCERSVLTSQQHPNLIKRIEQLEYGVLMPWIGGQSWWDVVEAKEPLTADTCLKLAGAIVNVLAGLEKEGLAHCDVGNTNIFFDMGQGKVWLIDIEEMYIPGLNQPMNRGFGTDGYRHRRNPGSLWGPFGDRFAGAILLSEILGWHDQSVRDLSGAEHYFDQVELHNPDIERYIVLKQVLRQWSPTLENLLENAWRSRRLSGCPKMQTWHQVIQDMSTADMLATRLGPTGQKIEWEEVEPTIRPTSPHSSDTLIRPPSRYETGGTVVRDLEGRPLLDGKRFYTDADDLSELWIDLKSDGYKLFVGEVFSLKLVTMPNRSYFQVNKEFTLIRIIIGSGEWRKEKAEAKKDPVLKKNTYLSQLTENEKEEVEKALSAFARVREWGFFVVVLVMVIYIAVIVGFALYFGLFPYLLAPPSP